MKFIPTFFVLLCFAFSVFSEEGPGEFDLPDTIPLPMESVTALRELIRTDPEAAERMQELKLKALPLLGQEATPLRVIHYEGLVNTNPKRIETVKSLKQTGEAADLIRYWQATGDPKAKATLLNWMRAWFRTYKPDGNDVNENKLFPLLISAYYFLDELETEEQEQFEAYIRKFAQPHLDAVSKSDHLTNRYTKHVRLAVVCGLILEEPDWVAKGPEGVKRFVEQSLYADGGSRDLEWRDTLTYHTSALRPPLHIAMLMPDGASLYNWQNSKGGSLKKSVDYVVPYAMGEKVREEWKNSKVGLDHRRAAAGLEHYRQGRLYDPKQATELMELASFFDPELMKVVLHLSDSEDERFPTWQTLVNTAVAKSRVE